MEAQSKYAALRTYFGHTAFRPGQEVLIDAILAGRDALGIMPTGGGKSICYQIPALLLPGVTLVISPLISLMKDQVANLERAGIPAAFINSSLPPEELRQVYRRAQSGEYRLLYVAPERLDTGAFSALAQRVPISLVAVDEAHCISQWGQNFRPSYLRIPDFVASLPRRPVVAAFTATATAEVQADIRRLLDLRDPVCSVTGFDRPNLFFDVQRPRRKLPALLEILRARSEQTGIVYCATRASAEKICSALTDEGISAACYHAGMSDEARRASQEDFRFDRKRVIVATNAFGMGIDKSNVDFVIHYHMPKSLEAYYQEAGRAGRDGGAADCILFYAPGDVETAKHLIQTGGNEELTEAQQALVRQRDFARLRTMTAYCTTTKCLRGTILDYFGQPHPPTCGNCGNCRSRYELRDITVPAQMILSCVYRIREKLGYGVGRALVVQTLRGSRDQRVRSLRLDQLSTYGLLKDQSAETVRGYIDRLEEEGFLRTDPEHFTLAATPAAADVLFHGQAVILPVRVELAEIAGKKGKHKAPSAPAVAPDPGLLAALKAVRTQRSLEEHVPAYLVFTNAALSDMAAKAPRTMEAFLEVSGVGKYKAERYGELFLQAIADYLGEKSEE